MATAHGETVAAPAAGGQPAPAPPAPLTNEVLTQTSQALGRQMDQVQLELQQRRAEHVHIHAQDEARKLEIKQMRQELLRVHQRMAALEQEVEANVKKPTMAARDSGYFTGSET